MPGPAPGQTGPEAATQLRQLTEEIANTAGHHQADPRYWQPVADGWLVQDPNSDLDLMLLVNRTGDVQQVLSGGFPGTTTDSVAEASYALREALTGHDVIDPENGVVRLALPSGAQADVQFMFDPNLREGEAVLQPAESRPAATNWVQTEPATVALSTTVRTDPQHATLAMRAWVNHLAQTLDAAPTGSPSDLATPALADQPHHHLPQRDLPHRDLPAEPAGQSPPPPPQADPSRYGAQIRPGATVPIVDAMVSEAVAVVAPTHREPAAPAVAAVREWLVTRFADGADPIQLRVEAVAVLGAEAATVRTGRPRPPRFLRTSRHPRITGALTALTNLWRSEQGSPQLRQAVAWLARDLLSQQDAVRPLPRERLPDPVRDFLAELPAPDSIHPPAAGDPEHPMRARALSPEVDRLAAAVEQIATGDGRLADPASALAPAAAQLGDLLDQAAAGFAERAQDRFDSAQAAERKATQQQATARREAELTDRLAPERARTAQVKARQERAAAWRRLEAAIRYEQVQRLAVAGRDAFRGLEAELATLARHPDSEPTPVHRQRLAWLAEQARQAYLAYRDAALAAQPVAVHAAVPVGELPHLHALAGTVNAQLAQRGISETVTPQQLSQRLLPSWRWVASQDGVRLPIGTGSAQVWLRFRPGDAVETAGYPLTSTQIVLAQLPQYPQGSRAIGGTRFQHLGSDLTIAAGRLLDSAVTGGTLDPLLRHTAFDVRYHRNRVGWLDGTATDFTMAGHIFDERGEAGVFSLTGGYELRVRRDSEAHWSDPVQVSTPAPGDQPVLRAWIPRRFLDPAPHRLVHHPAPRFGFPPHAVTGMSGLWELADHARSLIGPVGEISRHRLHTIITEELPARLTRAVDEPSGFQRPIYAGDELLGLLRIQAELVTVSPEGAAAERGYVEDVRFSVSGATGSRGISGGAQAGADLGVRSTPYGESSVGDAGLQAQACAGAGRGWSESSVVGGTTMGWKHDRYSDHTQGYRVQLRLRASFQPLHGSVASTEPVASVAHLQVPESYAYRSGFPVDERAVRTGPGGSQLSNPDGSQVLRDDPLPGPPPGRQPRPPDWLVTTGGAGFATVRDTEGMAAVREQVTRALRDDGLLPPIDAHGWPILSSNSMVAASQLANLQAVDEQLSATRIEGTYNQAAQTGYEVHLVEHRLGRNPRHVTVRVALEQDWGATTLLGHHTASTVVNVDVAAHQSIQQSARSHSRGLGIAVSGSLGANPSSQPAPPPDGWVGRLGLHLQRRAASRVEWRAGDTARHGVLIESEATGLSALFRVPHTVTVSRVEPDGGSTTLATGPGAATVVLPADLLPAEEPLPAAVSPGLPAEVAVWAKVLHVGARGFWPAVESVLPHGSAAGSAARAHLFAFVDTHALATNQGVLTAPYRTDLAVDPRARPDTPGRSSLEVTAKVDGVEFVGPAKLNVRDINFTMDTSSHTAGRERTRTGAVQGRVSTDAHGRTDQAEGSVAGSQVAASARTFQQMAVEERTGVQGGLQYVFSARVNYAFAGTEHGVRDRTRTTDPVRSTVVFAVPERVALRSYADGNLALPPEQVADVLHRHATGKLELDPELVDRLRPDPDPAPAPAPAGQLPPGQVRTERRLPGELSDGLGLAWLEPVAYFVGPDGKPVPELLTRVRELVETAAPGAFSRAPGLYQQLYGQLVRQGWVGKLSRMLRPGGWSMPVDVPINRYLSQRLTITLTAELSTGRYLAPSPESGVITQRLLYEQQDSASTGGGAGTAGGTAGAEGYASGQAMGGRDYTGRDWVSTQHTQVQRARAFEADGMDRYQRDLAITVRVERGGTHRLDRALRGGIEVVTRSSAATVVEQTLRATLVQQLPPNVLAEAPAAALDPRPVPLPTHVTVEQFDSGALADQLRARLRRVLGERALARVAEPLRSQLSATALDAKLSRMASQAGYPVVDLVDPAHPRSRTQVMVRAVASEVRAVTPTRSNIEIGYDSRSQHTAARQVRRSQILPATGGFGTPPRLPVSLRVNAGQGGTQHDTELTGDRDETRAYAKGDAVTVAVRLDFTAAVVTHRLGADSDRVRRETGLGLIASGTATLTIAASDVARLREQLHSGRQDLLERLLDQQPAVRRSIWRRFRHRLDPGTTAGST